MSSQGGIAIVGMATLFPGAPDLDAYWRIIRDGADQISTAPDHRWDQVYYDPDAKNGAPRADRIYCRRGGFVDDIAHVDVSSFGIVPSSAADIEPDQLLALHVAHAAVEDAGGRDALADPERVGVILGRGGYSAPGATRLFNRVQGAHQLAKILKELLPDLDDETVEMVREGFAERVGATQPSEAIGLVPNLAASRVANRLDFRGPAYTIDGACASALIAVDHAARELDSGRCDAMVVGGVHHIQDISFWSVFTQLRALSLTQQIRPFDRRADGTLVGEGTGMVVLKRLDDARRDGDRIYAVIRGVGVSSDGRTTGLANPNSDAQVRAVRAAWAQAGVDPASPGALGLLEAHGTATASGDRTELTTLRTVFGLRTTQEEPAVIGTVKSLIGHTMPASGMAGLIKAALAIHTRTLLPTLHCQEPNELLADMRFAPIAEARPWPGDPTQVRRAGVNAFGFGGINAHVVLESPTDPQPCRFRAAPQEILRFAGRDRTQVIDLLDAYLAHGRRGAQDEVGAPSTLPCRLVIRQPTALKVELARTMLKAGQPWSGTADIVLVDEPLLGVAGGDLAFVFSGLEADFSPRVDDLAQELNLATALPDTSTVGAHATNVMRMGMTLDAGLRAVGIEPDVIAGVSLGEMNALMAAQVIAKDLVDRPQTTYAMDFIRSPQLPYAVVIASAADVARVIADGDYSQIAITHDNAPQQTLISGHPDQVTRLLTQLRAQGIAGGVIPLRSGFHTPWIEPFLAPVQALLTHVEPGPPTVPVWSAMTAAPYPGDPAEIRAMYTRNLVEPVRLRELVLAMYEAGVRGFVQVGSGLDATLMRQTLGDRPSVVIAANVAAHSGIEQLRWTDAVLWAAGHERAPGAIPAWFDAETATPALAPAREVTVDLGSPLYSLTDSVRTRFRAALRPGAPNETDLPTGVAATHPPAKPTEAAVPAGPADEESVADPVTGADVSQYRLTVSTETMPFLTDHCFYRQPEGWPDIEDRWPVVPGMTIVHYMMEAVLRLAPGHVVTAVEKLQLKTWLTAEPAVDVEVTVTRIAPDRAEVTFGPYSSAVVTVAPQYSPIGEPHEFLRRDSRPASIAAEEVYTRRAMFHGPAFQGISALHSVGPEHIHSSLTVLETPGALLDNAGQTFGFWLLEAVETDTRMLPTGFDSIEFAGPAPAAGSTVECRVLVTELSAESATADIDLLVDGQLWARIRQWGDRRFENDPITADAESWPGQRAMSVLHEDGTVVLRESWRALASRQFVMRNNLAADERREYEAVPPLAQRTWLMGRIVAKDAVRHHLWSAGDPAVFPAEIRVTHDAHGRPVVSGRHGRELGDLEVSVAHVAGVAVGYAAMRGEGPLRFPGIDIVAPAQIDVEAIAEAFTRTERARFAALDESADTEVYARAWAAKEAVGKASGLGLDGRPTALSVVDLDLERAVVAHGPSGMVARVRFSQLAHPATGDLLVVARVE